MTRARREAALASAAVLVTALGNARAFAQDAPPPERRDPNEIVITAQRKEQLLRTAPIAVSAFDPTSLAKKQIETPSDLQLTIPNLVYSKTSFSLSSFTIRGIGDLCAGTSCDQATAIHLNGSPTPGTRIFETEFMDIERIEVLRGPQGTLFGRNATAGVVNIITAKPVIGSLAASGKIEAGNYNSVRLEGMANVPLGNTAAVRIAGYGLTRDGYTRNLYDGSRVDNRDSYGLRGSIRWRPNGDTTLDLLGSYFSEDDRRLRIQKQLCHRDPTGVLGCLPDSLAHEYVNTNATLASLLSSVQTLRLAGGPVLGGAFAPLGLTDITGPDMLAGQVNPASDRSISTAYKPYYRTSERQLQATLQHDFGPVRLQVQGINIKSKVASSEPDVMGVFDRSGFAPGLGTLAFYSANGIPGLPGSAAYFAPGAAVLMPQGPSGVLCTSVPDESSTGVFGGHAICSQAPISDDRSSSRTSTSSGEVLLTSRMRGPVQFLLGAIYLDNRIRDNHYNVEAFTVDYAAAVLGALTALGRTLRGTPTPPAYLGPSIFDNVTSDFRLKSYGVFAEAYLQASDRVRITAGLRYNNDRKSLSARATLLNFLVPYGTSDVFASPFAGGYDADPATPCPAPGSTTVGGYGTIPGCDAYQLRSDRFDAFTGRVVADVWLNDNDMAYASYSRGYKSGGINPPVPPGISAPASFDPEFVNAFELGSKGRYWDGAVTLNGAAFYYQYKGLQIARPIGQTVVDDNVDAKIYGVELEGTVRPRSALSIDFSASAMHTQVTGDLEIPNLRDPAAGRGDVVVLKDLQRGFNCVVVPNSAGGGAAARSLVTLFNGSLGLPGPSAFPAGSGVAATGAFGLCGPLAATIANPSPALRAIFNTPTGALPFTILNVGIPQDIKGKQLPQSPAFKLSIGIDYTFELPHGRSLVPRIDVIGVGPSFGNIFNGSVNRIPAYAQVNAQIQLNGPGDRWFVRAFVKNLTNSSAITGMAVADQTQGLATNLFLLEPRRYGIAGGLRF